MKTIFKANSLSFVVDFNNSQTAQEIVGNLPLESVVSTWGDEIYFDMGFKASAENAVMEVSIGDVAYWPQGKCLCIFFGPTPASISENPVPASPVVIVGKAETSKKDLKTIRLGERIKIELVHEE